MDGSARTPSLEELLGQERWLRVLARRLVRDAATADDLVQETWFRVLGARGDGHAVDDLRAWLGRVLRNVWRERARSERTRGRREARVAVSEALPSAGDSLERVELARQLAALVLELPEPYRSILVWRYYEGRSAAAIGAALGEPATRVRWRLMRARELLRQRLERERGDWVAGFALFLPLAQRSSVAAAGAAGIGVFSMGVKAFLGLGAAALLTWTLVHLGSAPRAPEPAASAGLAQVIPEPALATPPPSGERVPFAETARAVPPADGTQTSSPAPDPSTGLRGLVHAAEDGRALAGAEVALFRADGRSIHASTRSGADGTFRLEGLEPGGYDVACRLEGRRPRRLRVVELAAGSESELVIGLERGFLAAVLVVESANDAPVAGAEVELVPGDRDAVVWLSPDDLRFLTLSAVTGPDGHAQLGGAERGTYQYVVRAPDHATALGEALLEPDAETLRIAIDRGGAVYGGVWHASGAPAEGARVFLNPVQYVKGLSDFAFRQNGVSADRHGRYRLEGVPAGVYNAVALLPDGSGAFHFDAEAAPRRALGHILVTDAAEVPLDFHLPTPGRVRARVLDAAGAPIPGARVNVSWGDFKADGAGFFPIAEVAGVKESIHHSTETDSEGRFELAAVRISHEPLELRVRADGYVASELELDVPPGATLEPVLTLQALGATLRGRLTDAEGTPVAGQSVGAFESDGQELGAFFQAKSAADGSYELTVAAAGARHRVQPILHDSDPFRCEPELREGVPAGASGVDFVLHAKRRLHGTVVDDTGSAVRDFVVHALERAGGAQESWDARDEANRGEGRYELFVDPARVSQLCFSAPGCDPLALRDLGHGDFAHGAGRTLVLRRASDLEGVLLDGQGRGVAGAVVALATLDSAIYPRGTGFAPRATTDAAGRFRLRGVPDPSVAGSAPLAGPGHLLVCPRREDAPALLHYPLPVPRGARVELVLPRAVPVELVFAGADGEPVEGGVLVVDGQGWPLEPAFETHLADQASETRGVLNGGRARLWLLPGPHHAILVRGIEAETALPFAVQDPGAGDAELQTLAFTVEAGD